jgi:hypothetical protein
VSGGETLDESLGHAATLLDRVGRRTCGYALVVSAEDAAPTNPPEPPPPVDGLVREVEPMADGRRRITYYSHAGPQQAEDGS